MPAHDIIFRRLRPADAEPAFNVYRTALNEYLERARQELVPEENDQTAGFLHYLRHDASRAWGAERGGELVAYGVAIVRGDWWFLGSLFVLPQAQGSGVGAELLRLAMSGVPAGSTLATVTDTLQPISNTLYARRGMLPREVLLGFGGSPGGGGGGRPAGARAAGPKGAWRPPWPGLGSLRPEPLTPAAVPDLQPIDAAATGLDRGVDHAFYLGDGGRRGWLLRRSGRPVAYVLYRDNGWVGPLASVRREDVAPVLAFALEELAAAGLEKVSLGVPASCEGAQRVLWEAGLVYQSTPGLLLASRPFGRLDRYLPASYGLF